MFEQHLFFCNTLPRWIAEKLLKNHSENMTNHYFLEILEEQNLNTLVEKKQEKEGKNHLDKFILILKLFLLLEFVSHK